MSEKRKRNRNHTGTIRKRKDGLYEGRYTAPDGLQRSVYGTEKEVKAKLRKALAEVTIGTWVEPSRMTVKQWLEIWLADYLDHTRGRTKETYKWICEHRFYPSLGHIHLAQFNTVHVMHMLNDMQRSGLAPATIVQARNVLYAAMKAAVSAKLIASNPVTDTQPPKIPKRKFCIVDRDNFPAFIAAAGNTRYENVLLFLIMTGLRASELCALRWSDVDFDNATVSVNRQLLTASAAKRSFRPPKDDSTREICLPPEAVAVLKAQRKAQLEQRMSRGSNWYEDEITEDLVFRRANGKNLTESILYNAVHAVGAEIGLPELHPHDLRHSYAVAALRAGADIKSVQHNLGHKSAVMTLDIYAGYTSDAGRTSAERFSDYWTGATN